MPDRRIKRQPHPDRTRENSWPTTVCAHLRQSGQSVVLLVPYCLSGYKSIMQNEPNFRNAKTNTTSCTRCHSDRRHATSVPKRRNLLQYSRHLPNRLFGPIYQRIIACIMQNKANFLNDKPNVTFFVARNYENKPPSHDPRKQTQSNPILPPRRVLGQKTQDIAVLRGFMGRLQDTAQRMGTFFVSFAAGSMFPIL